MIQALFLSLFLTGCDNPTEGKPAAEVHEPAAPAEPAEPAAAEPAAEPAGAAMKGDNTNSTIGFVGAKLTGSHEGGFNVFNVTAHVDNGHLTGLEGSIDMASTFTDAEKLTGHLKSPDFFNIEQFTTATFKSSSIGVGVGESTVTGTLDFHGVQKDITFPATVTITPNGATTITSEFSLNRKDFGVEYPGKPDDLIKDDVLVKLSFNLAG